MEQAKRLLRELAEANNAMQSNEIFGLMPPYFPPLYSCDRQGQSHTDISLPMPPTSLSCPLLHSHGSYQGDPGDGKTTFILNIAAKLSKGENLDNGMNFTEPLNVIYQSAEDGLADTVKAAQIGLYRV